MRFIDLIFTLFLLTNSLDPAGYYGKAKYILFVILVIYGLFSFVKNNNRITYASFTTVISFLFLPLWGIIVACVSGYRIDEGFAQSHLLSLYFVLLFFYLITVKTEVLLKLLWLNGLLLSILTLSFFALSQFIPAYFDIIYNLGLDSGSFLTANNRNFAGIIVNGLYFKSGPLIIFAFIYNLYHYSGRGKFVLSCILFLSLVFSGSRTPALVNIFILLLFFYDKIVGSRKSILLIISILFLISYIVITLAVDKGGDGSNSLKFENIQSYIEDLSQGLHFLFGSGVGSLFYAKGNGAYLAFTELSYLDILRMYGLPLGFFLIYLYGSPYLKVRRFFKYSLFLKRYFGGYILYLVLAGTNPILMGSVGMLAFTVFLAMSNRINILYKKSKTIEDIWRTC